jgi:UDP-N-acetylmuramate--alanine ligase
VHLRLPGRHNVANALAAIAVGRELSIPFPTIARAISEFTGVVRRFETKGERGGVLVVDDYAHHPTEIAATLASARQVYPDRRIVALFQPHLFSRTRDFARDFANALASADAIFLTEIYPSREQPIPGVTSSLIADRIPDSSRHLAWRGQRAELAPALAAAVRDGDLVIVMGAGDITQTAPELLALLRERR